MNAKNLFLRIFLTVFIYLTGCRATQYLSEEEVRVNPKTGEVTNTEEVSINQYRDINVAREEIEEMKNSIQVFAEEVTDTSSLIFKNGKYKGHIANLSNYPLNISIYRLIDGEKQKIYGKMLPPMTVRGLLLWPGNYYTKAVLFNGEEKESYFKVTMITRNDYEVKSNKKTISYPGYWYIYNHEQGELLASY